MTLIEVIVVLFIIALASAVAGPAVMNRLDNLALQSTATELIAELRRADLAARTERIPIVCAYDTHQFRFLKKTSPISTYDLPPSVAVLSAPQPATFLFLPSGQILGPDHIELQNARGRHATIRVSFLGGIALASSGIQ